MQFVPGFTIVVQVEAVRMKSLGFAPLIRLLETVTANVPVLVSVTSCEAVVLPKGTAGNVRAVGETVSALVPAVAVRRVDPETAPLVALIVLVPAWIAAASPVALIVAFAGVLEVHVTVAVRS